MTLNKKKETTEASLKDFNSPSLANLVSALATIGHATPELFHMTAKVDSAPPAFLDAITDVTPSRMTHHNSQVLVPDAVGIASTVWTFAKLGQASPELFEAIAVVFRVCLRYYNSQDLAHTVWALVYLITEVAAGSSAELARSSMSRMHRRSSRDIASQSWPQPEVEVRVTDMPQPWFSVHPKLYKNMGMSQIRLLAPYISMQLEDGRTLSDRLVSCMRRGMHHFVKTLNIRTIPLASRMRGGMHIVVKTLTVKTVTLEGEAMDMQEDIPPDQ